VTLVLTALTQNEVIQVSDRRYTYIRGSEVVKRDDENNKAVLFCGRLMFSFTGIGDLGMERQTDLWLAGRICDVIAEAGETADQVAVLRGLRDRATDVFRKLRYRGQRHAFVGVGWARFDPERPDTPALPDELSPYLAVISNFHDGQRELPAARPEFSLYVRRLGADEKVRVFDAPHHLSTQETNELSEKIVTADAVRDPEAMARALGECIRAVASRDAGVGAGLMINYLPRNAVGATDGFMAIAGGPLSDTQTFLYVPPSGDTTVQLGPVATCGGGILAGFRSEPAAGGMKASARRRLADDPPGLVRRWYLVPIVGSGRDGDPYRAETRGLDGSAVIPSHAEGHPQHGHPKHDVALVLVSSEDHTPLEADPRAYPVANLADLDQPVEQLDEERRGWIDEIVALRQISGTERVRDVLRRLGRQLEPQFDENGYWTA
jgi:hypothetical protein